MKSILIIKTFSYDPTFGGLYSKYHGYDLITSQKKSPTIICDNTYGLYTQLSKPIYSSTLQRGQDTARLFGKNVKLIKELNEIKFYLKNLLSEEEYNIYGSNLVRERFIESFISDSLITKRVDIKKEIDNLLYLFQKLPDGTHLAISHSFKMKIMEIYIHHKNLFNNPTIIRNYFNTHKKTYNFGEGYNITF